MVLIVILIIGGLAALAQEYTDARTALAQRARGATTSARLAGLAGARITSSASLVAEP